MTTKPTHGIENWPIIGLVIRGLRWIQLPGFQGLSLYDLIEIYARGIIQGALSSRASSIAYSFFMAFFPFLLFAFLSFYYTNNYSRKYTEKLNIFFYFIISSILSTIIFISLSPSIISIYHFADIILFSLALYFSLILFTAAYKFINTTKFSNILFSDSAIIVFFIIFL